MALYSKVANRLFVVFVIIVCGGWYSDNRAEQIYEKQLADRMVVNTGIARDADAVELSVMQSQEEEKDKHKKRQKEKILVIAERKVEKKDSKRATNITQQARKMTRTTRTLGAGVGYGNDPKTIPVGCMRGSVECEDHIFLPEYCREAREDTSGNYCLGASTLHSGVQDCECENKNNGQVIKWQNKTYICCDLPPVPIPDTEPE